MKRVDKERELNEARTSLVNFATAYNRMLAPGFPHASPKALTAFRASYPLLFKNDDSWSIDKHRKRFMDWYASHRDMG